MYSRIRSCVCVGIEGREVQVETVLARGLPAISVVGLASTTVMESKERIRSAIINSGYEYPRGRITINLMPAELRKNSSCLDLPMAVGIIASEGLFRTEGLSDWAVIGELTLDGRVSEVRGALPMLMHLRSKCIDKVIIPRENINEAGLSGIKEVYVAETLKECVEILNDPEKAYTVKCVPGEMPINEGEEITDDYADISGQENAKRAVVIATAGRHGLLMVGSPGCGKTMLAGRIPGIMPAMDERELIETAVIRSITGDKKLGSRIRPFRHPHHTIGRAGLLGGGTNIAIPGEISLAHNGVLFLDEICEFDRENIEGLRIPLEEKHISHFRKGETYRFPCDFQLVMASNPCPCGFFGDKEKECRCRQSDIERYQNKLSGPIMDRIDMKISMERVTYRQLTEDGKGLSSDEMRKTVNAARRFAKAMGRKGYNSDLTGKELEKHCVLGREEKRFRRDAYESLDMSPRAYVRTLKFSRTIADIAESSEIRKEHLAEALSYRM